MHELACAIIERATTDYLQGRIAEREFKRFCTSSYFTAISSIDGKWFYENVRNKKHEQKKHNNTKA